MGKTLKLYLVLILVIILKLNTYSQNWTISNHISSDIDVRLYENIVDRNNNSYFTGIYKGTINAITSKGDFDLFIGKYNENFQIDWFKSIGGSLRDFNTEIILDTINNFLYQAGAFQDTCTFSNGDTIISSGDYDIFLNKFDLNGNLIWKKHFCKGPGNQKPTAIDIDKDNNIILAGQYADSAIFSTDTLVNPGSNLFISKFDTEGNIIWNKSIACESSSTKITALKAYSDGYYFDGYFRDDFFLDVGTITGTVPLKSDIFLYKTNFDGNGQWARRSYGSLHDVTGTITQDKYGNIYFTGYFDSNELTIDSTASEVSNKVLYNQGDFDFFIMKYNRNGNLIWSKSYGNTGRDYCIKIKENNNLLYLGGYYTDTINLGNDTLTSSSTADRNLFVSTFDLNGNAIKSSSMGNSDGNETVQAIDINNNGEAIVGGNFSSSQINIGDSIYINSSSSFNIFIAKYNSELAASFTQTKNVSCNSGSDGELVVTPYFGTAPYTYDWSHDAGLRDSTATGLIAGDYSVTVTDGVDSTSTIGVTLIEPDAFLFSPVITNVATCSYSTEGAINLNTTGGNGGNEYVWEQSNGGYGVEYSTEDQNSLKIGTYSVTVTDNKSCTADTSINITGPAAITFGASVVTDYNGVGSEGAIDLEIAGGTGTPSAYTADWTGPDGYTASTQDINTLEAGNYNITSTDNNSCTADTSFNVINKNIFYAYISSKKNACNGVADGRATVSYYSPVGNTDISYLWDANAGNQTSVTAINLAGGHYYKVTVTDNVSSDESIDSVFIEQLTYDFSGTLAGTENLNCKDDNDGYINLTIDTEGELPYTYSWNTGAETQDLSGLIAGNYNVTVVDNNECQFITSTWTINEPDFALSASVSIVSEPLCYGDMNGELRVEAAGGKGTYTYQWDDPAFQTTQNADLLETGYYNVSVEDYKGCKASAGIYLNQPESISINETITDVKCFNGNDGSIQLEVSGGTPDFDYFWETTDGAGLIITDKNQSALEQGTYSFTATDAHNCTLSKNIVVSQPASAIGITVEDKTDIANCYGDNTGEITVNATGGTGALTYTLNPGASQTNGTGDFAGLLAGTYSVDVTDENNCGPETSSSLIINEPDEIEITVSDSSNVLCNGENNGSINISVTGGTVVSDYIFNWETSDGSGLVAADEDQTGLTAGTYTVTVTDDNACEKTLSIVLSEPEVLAIDSENHTDATTIGGSDGTITIAASGGTTPYTYHLLSSTVSNNDGLFTGLLAGEYTVEVTDVNSCGPITTSAITIKEPVGIEDILKSKAFQIYPNPANDKLFIVINNQIEDSYEIRIINISGQVVKIFTSYNNKQELDISSIAKGIYFVKIISDNISDEQKLIIH